MRGRSFKSVVSLVLLIAVPFCCCNFRAWLTGNSHCDEDAGRNPVVAIAHLQADACESDSNTDHQPDSGRTKCHEALSDKSGPCSSHHGGQDDCSCGKHDSNLPAAAKPSCVLQTPVLVAILDWAPSTDRDSLAQSPIHRDDVWAVPRPPTSLLQLHCALVV